MAPARADPDSRGQSRSPRCRQPAGLGCRGWARSSLQLPHNGPGRGVSVVSSWRSLPGRGG